MARKGGVFSYQVSNPSNLMQARVGVPSQHTTSGWYFLHGTIARQQDTLAH